MSEVVLLDYGAGNVGSVARALERVGARALLTADPARVAGADRVVFPGQGALPDVMARLRAAGLDDALRTHFASGRPYLGICLGLQALFEWGEEHGGAAGLGVLPGTVRRFPDRSLDGSRLKVPHMGWSAVRFTESGRAHPVFRGLAEPAWFYFVHSYFAAPAAGAPVAAEATHGVDFCAAVARDRLVACQFHPERSQAEGEKLLRAWLAL